MGIIYSYCFHKDPEARAEAYKIEEEPPKTYSWDKRDKTDPKKFMFDGLEDTTTGKLPGEIHGQQFVIQNCKKSVLYLFDNTASVTVDDCSDCVIFIGPCKGSVFIRDCQNCHLMVICQQFRTRDCKNFDIFLFCQTQPIIEESTSIRFGCIQLHYERLQDQLKTAGLSVFNNRWSNVHDFSPLPDSQNFTYLPKDSNAMDRMGFESTDDFSPPTVSCAHEDSDFPLNVPERSKVDKTVCFVLCFCEQGQSVVQLRERCMKLIKQVQKEGCDLINTKELSIQPQDSERIIGTKDYKDLLKNGAVIGLELSGEKAAELCKTYIDTEDKKNVTYIADSSSIAADQLRHFYSYADMLLGV